MNNFPKDFASSFLGAFVAREELVFVGDLIGEDQSHTHVYQWKQGKVGYFRIDWPAISMTASGPPTEVISMGPDGDIHIFNSSGRHHERIDGPQFNGPLRDMRSIGGDCYAAGMQRQVYRRAGPDDWSLISSPILDTDGEGGFNSIDGFSHDEIYAAGLDGEIWRFDGEDWAAIKSGTSYALQRVLCASNGTVYIVGQCGVILAGRGDVWAKIDTGGIEANWWGVEWFEAHLYVSSDKGVYKLSDGKLVAQDIGATGYGAATSLHAGYGMLWSVGGRHVAYTRDGETWTPEPLELD